MHIPPSSEATLPFGMVVEQAAAQIPMKKLCSSCVQEFNIDDFVRNKKTNKTCNKCGAKKHRHDQKKRETALTRLTDPAVSGLSSSALSQPCLPIADNASSAHARARSPVQLGLKRKRSSEGIVSIIPIPQRPRWIDATQSNDDNLLAVSETLELPPADVDESRSTITTPDLISDLGSTCSEGNSSALDEPATQHHAELAPHRPASYPVEANSRSLAVIVEDKPSDPGSAVTRNSQLDRVWEDPMDALSTSLRRLSHHSSLRTSSLRTLLSSKLSSRFSRQSFMPDWSAPMPAPMGTEIDDEIINARETPDLASKVAKWKLGSLAMQPKSKFREEMFKCAVTGDVPKLRIIVAVEDCDVNDALPLTLSAAYPTVRSLLELAVHLANPPVVRFLVHECTVNSQATRRATDMAIVKLKECVMQGRVETMESILHMDLIDASACLPDGLHVRDAIYSAAVMGCQEPIIEALLGYWPPDSATRDSAQDTLMIELQKEATLADPGRRDALLRINTLMNLVRPSLLDLKLTHRAKRTFTPQLSA